MNGGRSYSDMVKESQQEGAQVGCPRQQNQRRMRGLNTLCDRLEETYAYQQNRKLGRISSMLFGKIGRSLVIPMLFGIVGIQKKNTFLPPPCYVTRMGSH